MTTPRDLPCSPQPPSDPLGSEGGTCVRNLCEPQCMYRYSHLHLVHWFPRDVPCSFTWLRHALMHVPVLVVFCSPLSPVSLSPESCLGTGCRLLRKNVVMQMCCMWAVHFGRISLVDMTCELRALYPATTLGIWAPCMGTPATTPGRTA